MQDIQISINPDVVAAKVLLVDDQAIIGEAIRRILATEPSFSFHFCSDATQALQVAKQVQPTVILQDLVMPQTDGLTLVRAYRADEATEAIPIIVLSTKEEPKIKSAAFAMGANDYLVKLPDALELIARIKYHSRSYIALRQRDEATQALQVSQSQLLHTHQELQLLLDTVPTGILKLDAMGRIVQYNKAAQVLLSPSGVALDSIIFSELLEAQARDDFATQLQEAIQQKQSTYIEANLLLNPAMPTLPVEYLITRLPTTQGIELSLVIRDITERKAVDKAKNEFFATMSHELRTPLTSIRGSLAMILSGKFGELNDKTQRMLEVAHRNSDHIGRLINDILDMEKMAMGGMDFTLSEVDADLAMETAISANEGYALRYNVQLQIIQPSQGLRVQADEVRLQQVFANLISNAIKYSHAHAVVELKATHHQQMVRFSVRDYGVGIPESFREHVFNRFAQANTAKAGTGLGLNIARSIVEYLGGQINFHSSEQGTEFYFDLPRVNR
ncbi:ATP-binding protein [Agitococcus lubricus]|uniref:histidine kinase n=1 Tax=Agitococcus lubricus TaxID=1077255 RepID=A0A2T5IVH0_9GAMM|nr:ATP-binding protein [Agitococcus lubricus]PTQ87875.1 signal transduction histidine kinase [Agitococcus lubricus]